MNDSSLSYNTTRFIISSNARFYLFFYCFYFFVVVCFVVDCILYGLVSITSTLHMLGFVDCLDKTRFISPFATYIKMPVAIQ